MLASTLENLGIGDAAVVALLGYAVVFFGLILLMIVVMLMGKAFIARDRKISDKSAAAANAVSAMPEPQVSAVPAEPQVAPGTAGSLKLYDVEPKIAAMLMAIVANKMGKPLNELRFISIKEVK